MVSPGDRAPEFTVESTTGASVTLSETLEDGPSVVLLNRGVWCSYCAEQLQTFDALAYDLWRHNDATIYPVFPEPVPDLVEMQGRFDLGFPLCSDPSLEVAEAYTDVETSDDHGEIPISGTFLVDEDRTVRYRQVAETAADRTYANYVRHLLNNDYEPPYVGESP